MYECQPQWFVMTGLVPMRNKLLTVCCLIWSLLPKGRGASVAVTPPLLTSPVSQCPPLTSECLLCPPLPRAASAPAWLPVTRSPQVSVGHHTPSHPESSGENRTGKHDIYRKSFIEFCKNHQYWKLKEKLFSFQPNLNEPLTTWPQQV